MVATASTEEKSAPAAVNSANLPVQEAQLAALEEEAARYKEDQQRLTASISSYQAKIESVPIREQQITDLIRDYETSKAYYHQLLEKKLSAETATQLEIRQQGERFTILDPARVPEEPSRPNRLLLNGIGSAGGLGLGVILALVPEFWGVTITSVSQIGTATGLGVLGTVPFIWTRADRRRRQRWLKAGAASGIMILLAVGAFLLYHFRT